MSEEIIKILDELGEKFGVAIDWTSENIAPYLTELYERAEKYLVVNSIATLIMCIVLFTASLFVLIKITKCVKRDSKTGARTIWFNDYCCCDSTFSVICRIMAAIILFTMTISIPFAISDLIKTIYIPEIMMIEMIEM